MPVNTRSKSKGQVTEDTVLGRAINASRYSKCDVADMAGISYRAITYYIRGQQRPNSAVIAHLAYILDVDAAALTYDYNRLLGVGNSSQRRVVMQDDWDD